MSVKLSEMVQIRKAMICKMWSFILSVCILQRTALNSLECTTDDIASMLYIQHAVQHISQSTVAVA